MRRILLGSITISFFAGTLMRSYAWLAILGRTGAINWLIELAGVHHSLKLAYSFSAMLVACIQIELPLFVLPLYGVMRGIDRTLARAAQSLGADPLTAWLTTFFPLTVPGIAVSTGLVFLTTLGFYVTPSLLGPPSTYLLAQELEVRINTLGDEGGASARIVVMLVLILAVAAVAGLIYRWSSRRREHSERLSFGGPMEQVARWLAPWRWIFVSIILAADVLLLLAPMVMLPALAFNGADYMSFPPHSFSLRWFSSFLGDPDMRAATWFSLEISLASAAVASVTGAAAALAAQKLVPRLRLGVSLLATAPLVVSSITVTAALFPLALRIPWLEPSSLFVAVYSVLGLPFGFLLVGTANTRLDPRLSLAAYSLGASPWTAMWTVILPLVAPSFVSAFVFAFLLAFDDVSAGLFLSTSDRTPLAMQLWETLKYAITPLPAAIAVLAFAVGFVIYVPSRVARRLRRASSSNGSLA
jgi:putative spermidine/putrescine transport system permease protein